MTSAGARATAGRATRTRLVPIALASIVALAFGIRLALGMRHELDADEASLAIASLRLLDGQLAIMAPSGRYLGAQNAYAIAPFVAVLGPTLLAVRLAMAVVGALYAATTFWLGRTVLGSARSGLLAAALASVFPLFAVTIGTRAWSLGAVLLLEALILTLAARALWPSSATRRVDWAALGLAVGVGLWLHPLLAMPVALVAAALALRRRQVSWRTGLPPAALAAVVGFSPWLFYNTVLTQLGSVRHLYSPFQAYSIPTGVAAGQVVTAALPIFVGARIDFCGPETVPWPTVAASLGLLALAVVVVRRRALVALLHGSVEPLELVLALAPISVAAVTVRFFNGQSCEPRYLTPLAVPLVVAVALALARPWPWRAVAAVAAAAWLAIASVTAYRTVDLYADILSVPHGVLHGDTVREAARALAADPPEALWAQYWLARPIQYYSGDGFVVGEYGGYVGFRTTQIAAFAAEHPSWLFVTGDPEAASFEAECQRRGISYERGEPAPGLVLYSRLSARLTPDDLGLGGQKLESTDPDPPTLWLAK